MSPESLLAIDAEAELERLARAQLQGRWQLPAELVRLALRSGATEVRVRTGRRRVEVRAPAARIADEAVAAMLTALDHSRNADQRHAALVELEARSLVAVLAAVVEGAVVTVRLPAPGEGIQLRLERRRQRRLASPGGDELVLRLSGMRYPVRRARLWLASACRFAQRPVWLDGARVGGVPGPCLARKSVADPLPAWLAVPATGDAPTLWLLSGGVVAARATVPGYPAFWAAVEMAGDVPPGAAPAAFRAAVTPHLPALLSAVGELLLGLGHRLPDLQPDAAARVTSLILEAAVRRVGGEALRSVPLLPRVDSAGCDCGRVSLAELAASSRASEPLPRALAPGADPTRRLADGEAALIVADADLERVVECTGARLERVPERSGANGWRGLLAALRSTLAGAVARLRGGRRVPDDQLSGDEASLLALLREACRGFEGLREIAFCAGRGGVRRAGDRLLLPRAGQQVRRAVAALAADSAADYAVAALLLAEQREPDAAVRSRWLRRELGGSGGGR